MCIIMLKKKQIISFMLVFVLGMQSGVSCFASELSTNETLIQMSDLKVYDIYQDLVVEDIVQISNLEEREENNIEYTLHWDEDVTAEIKQINMPNNDIHLNVHEGDLYNELIITHDNRVFLDGNEVTLHEEEVEATPYILGTVEYSESPFAGAANAYTVTSGLSRYSIPLSEDIGDIGVTVLTATLAAVFGDPLSKILGGATLAINIIDIIGYNTPYAETLYYSVQGWDNPYLENGPTYYYAKHQIKWFHDSLYSNEATALRETYFSRTTLRDGV